MTQFAARVQAHTSRYRFGTHIFRFNEYISIQDEAGELHTFRVVSVAPVV
jgi:hypothetical protein